MIGARLVLSLLVAFALHASAQAEDAVKPQKCWTPQALAGTAQEIKPQRPKGPLDLTALKQQVVPPVTPVPQALRGSIRSVQLPPGEKEIALTFDLCEETGYIAGYDGRIVDLLRAQGVEATFFAGGKWLETHPERAEQLIADPLFEVGSHGLRHYDLSHTSGAALDEEIILPEAAYTRAKARLETRQCLIDQASPKPAERITLLRFPYGRCDPKSLAAAADAGLITVQWDLITGDPDPHVSAKEIARRILTGVHPGAIIVMHANGRGRNTAEALALALPKLREEGYSFVTVSELLKAGIPVIAQSCYQNRPGDSMRIARTSARKGSHDLISIFDSPN
jgi:peptidoglycan/xylan/chitin deacetylase (PgdA/CDA1 family)